jgi:N-acetylmuramoyl-L-alanine amidase/putative methionine-R-sulfoxide reductase with GAF domain
MATIPTKPERETANGCASPSAPAWPRGQNPATRTGATDFTEDHSLQDPSPGKPSQRDALQILLAFSALHEQVRRRKALAPRRSGFDAAPPTAEFEPSEQFVLDEVLQLVAERAVAITGSDGLAIALAENNEIVLRAAAGTVRPDIGARIDRDSAFSGASFRTAQTVNCDDTETDPRVNLQACRRLGARSMVAVPLCGRRRVIGLLEAFSSWPFAFNDSDVRNLTLLAELIVGALKPEDEDRFAQSAQVASTQLTPRTEPAPPSVASPQTQSTSAIVPAPTPPAKAPSTPASPIKIEPPASPPTPSMSSAMFASSDTPVAPVTPQQVKTEIASLLAPVTSAAPAKPEEAKPPISLERPTESISEAEIPLAAEPQLTLGKSETPRRPWVLVALVWIVVIGAFAAGVWWKWRATQLGTAIVTEKSSEPSTATTNEGSPSPAGPSGSATGATHPSSSTNAIAALAPESSEPAVSPATPEELAKFPHVTGIRHWSSADSSTVVLDLEDQVQYEAHRLTGPDRIYFDLHDTQLAPELASKSIDVGDALLSRIRVAQPVAGMTRVVLETKANPNFSVSLEPNPYRLVVELTKIGAPPKGAVNLFPDAEAERSRMAIVIPPPTKEDLQWRARVPKMRIVVDAGHGGWDLGTVGRRGLLEKDLVLEIAERLGKLLESRLGAEVIYTRQDDNYIPLDERAEIANQAQADLFISVHANYSDLTSARGVETYYTNTFTAPGSKDADAHANISARNNGTLTLTLADLHERVEQSRRLAASVQRSLYGALSVQNPGLRDRGIKEAGFVVLTESAMPGILAEVSFVSSPTDEQKLRSDGYREQIAEALYRGIARYAVNAHNVKMASK